MAAEPPSVKVWLDEVNRDELERVSTRINATRKAGDDLCSSAQARSADVDRMRELVATLRETCRGKGVWLAGEASTGARGRQRAAETKRRGEKIRSQLSRVNAKIGQASETGKVYEHIKKRLRRQYDETERAVATNAAALESLERGRQEHAQNVEAVQKSALHARRELADLRRAIAEHAEMSVGRLSDAEEALASDRRWAQRAKSLEEAGKPEIAPDAKEAPQRVQRLRHRASLEEAQLEDLEAAFSNIRKATGLTDVNDIVYKFTNRDQQYFQLQSTSTQTQERIEALKKEQVALRSTLSMVQGSGISFAGNRELYNEIDIRDTRLRRENNQSAAAKTQLLSYRVLLEESKTCIAKITQSLPASADKTLARVGALEDIPSALEVLEKQIAEMLAVLGPKIDLTKRPTGATKRPAGATPASPTTSGSHKVAATERGRGSSGDGSAGDDAMLVDGDAPNSITPRSRRESEALSIMGGADSPIRSNSSTAKDGAGGGGGGLDPQRVAKAKNSGTRAQKLKDGLGRNPSTVGGFDRGARNSAANFKHAARRGSSFALGSSRDLNGAGAMGASSPGAAQAFIVAQGKVIRAPASLFNQSEAEKLLFKSTMIMQPDNTPKNIRVPRKRFTAPSSVATLINKDYVFREDAMSDEDDVISFNSDEDGVFGAFDIDGDDVDTETAYFASDRIAMKTLETSHTRSAKKSGIHHPPPAAAARLHAVSNHGPNHGAAHGRKGGMSGNVQSHATLNGKGGGGRGRGNQRSAAVLKPHQGKTGAMRTQRSVLNVGRKAQRKNE